MTRDDEAFTEDPPVREQAADRGQVRRPGRSRGILAAPLRDDDEGPGAVDPAVRDVRMESIDHLGAGHGEPGQQPCRDRELLVGQQGTALGRRAAGRHQQACEVGRPLTAVDRGDVGGECRPTGSEGGDVPRQSCAEPEPGRPACG